ncbi:hypothetical protein [Oceanisphaera avium]|uniref:Uncharacterized protein n=1 Tax=Oceanisphaera avium TaxID=1903694 RepID=A0A1Y0CYQ2_9GAMM|nr:hypothetical protein [Oceanisphaera avium]ART79955.1 hypothetical protein CBP12_07165 [Oceanisphaera avium]
MSFHLAQRTLYTLLCDYIAQHGSELVNNPALKAALQDIEALIDFSLYQEDIAVDADAALRVSKVGLAWLDYAAAHPNHPQGYASQAKQQLESTAQN